MDTKSTGLDSGQYRCATVRVNDTNWLVQDALDAILQELECLVCISHDNPLV
jgi:hypothetical protein